MHGVSYWGQREQEIPDHFNPKFYSYKWYGIQCKAFHICNTFYDPWTADPSGKDLNLYDVDVPPRRHLAKSQMKVHAWNDCEEESCSMCDSHCPLGPCEKDTVTL